MPNFITYKKMMEIIDANPDLPIFTRHGFAFRGASLCEFKKEPFETTRYVREPGSLALIIKKVRFENWRDRLKDRYEKESYLECEVRDGKIIIQTYSENDMY